MAACAASLSALLCAADVTAPREPAIVRFSQLPVGPIALPAPGATSAAPGAAATAHAAATGAGWAFHPVPSAKHATQYALVRDDELNAVVLEGTADNAAGALILRFDGSASGTPVLRFQWKVGNTITRSDPTTKAGDDYAARIYVTFAYDPARATLREKAENSVAHMLYGETPPHAALAYVFTHKAARESIITSPYTRRVKKVVVDDDPASVGKWRQFERNLYDDYRRAFNEEPTRISGIALMVDTDNTGERARSRFGDISLRQK